MAIIKAVKNSHSGIKQIVDYITQEKRQTARHSAPAIIATSIRLFWK